MPDVCLERNASSSHQLHLELKVDPLAQNHRVPLGQVSEWLLWDWPKLANQISRTSLLGRTQHCRDRPSMERNDLTSLHLWNFDHSCGILSPGMPTLSHCL